MKSQEQFIELNEFFGKIDKHDNFFVDLDQALNALLSLQEDFNIIDFSDSLRLLFGEKCAEHVYNLLINFDNDDLTENILEFADPDWKNPIIRVMAKYGPWLNVLYNKDVRALGIKSFETSLVNKRTGWEIQSSLTTFTNNKFTFSDKPHRVLQYMKQLLIYIGLLNDYNKDEIDDGERETIQLIIKHIDKFLDLPSDE